MLPKYKVFESIDSICKPGDTPPRIVTYRGYFATDVKLTAAEQIELAHIHFSEVKFPMIQPPWEHLRLEDRYVWY